MLVLRTSNSNLRTSKFKNIKHQRGNYQTDSPSTETLYCLYCSPLNVLPRASSRITLNYSKLLYLFTEKFSRTFTIHPGIFRGRALWADSVSPRMNTIASRDQFKPIRIGENLVIHPFCFN